MSYYQTNQSQTSFPAGQYAGGGGGGGLLSGGMKLRLLIGAAIVLFSAISYFSSSQQNPITGKSERVAISVDDEIKLGLQHAGQMGQLSRNFQAQQRVAQIGARLIAAFERELGLVGKANPFNFEFHLLADRQTVNAFALPGGQVFISEGLLSRLPEDGQVAGVLAHEMGHVIERHSAKQMAKSGLLKGVTGAAGMLGGDASSSRTAAAISNLVSMRYSRDAEFEADNWGVQLSVAAGYHPQHLITVMEILASLGGGKAPPEFLSTHPSTDKRMENIKERIEYFASLPPVRNYEGFE